MELYPEENPSFKNVYESKYVDTVRNDELQRSTKLYEQAKDPWNTGVVPKPADASMFFNLNEDENYNISLTGEKIDKEKFKHNNMQPFLKGNVTQNTNVERTTSKLDKHTGVDKFYFQKREVEKFFQPIQDLANINGAKENIGFLQSRLETSKIYNNVLPFEQTHVGPGLNKGYTSLGSGGFQQPDALQYAMPKSLEELRSKVNQKENNFKLPIKAPPKGTEQRGIITPYTKNKPEKTYEKSEDNWFKTTGSVTKSTGRPELAVKATNRYDSHVEYTGGTKLDAVQGMGLDDDYGKQNIIVYDNERNETQKKTVVSNITSIVKAVINPIADALKYTIKEFLVDAPRAGGNPQAQIPSKSTAYDPDDVMKTTVKETLVHDSDVLNLSAPDQSYSALEDIAKTTVKETLVHDSENLNIKPGTLSYLKNEDNAKKTMKETLPVKDVVRNIGKGTYRVYIYDPELNVKKTVKETTIKGTAELGFIGGILNSILGGYATKEVEMKNTHKQFTSDVEEYGAAGSIYEHRQRNRDAEYNAEIDGARERLLIEAGHTPNPLGANVPIDKTDVHFKTNKLAQDSIAPRATGNVNVIYQQSPCFNECSITKDPEKNNAYENRLDGSIMKSLKSNEFNININPI